MNGHGSLNRIFRVVWNASLGVWQVASEHARGKGKTKSVRNGPRGFASLAAGSIMVLCHAGALAELPNGGQITAGSGTIGNPSNGSMVIEQTSQKMAIDWQSFSVGNGNSVQFIQPSAEAIALNRVLGGDPSVIRGTISANGRVVLLNPNGILFGPSSKVEVASLLASTLKMSNEDFMAGNFRLEGDSKNAVINQGSIRAADGGFVALVAAKIENVGDIRVRGGEVVMGSGRKVRLDLGGPIKIEIDEAVVDGYIKNGGLIKAEGGTVVMTVKTAGELASLAINNEGRVEVNVLAEGEGGTIRLLADGGTVTNSGTLNASAADGKGGHIEVTGERVGILDGSVVDASGATGGGTVLLGGDYQGKNAAVKNAALTFIEEGATIRANATREGDGGKVIVWSDDRTAYYGAIEAKGGAASGNGGFVEVSGKQYLDFQGTVDTSAADGRNGTLLLDPTNLTIGNVGTSGWITNNSNTFGDFTDDTNPSPAHDFSFLRVDVLLAALANNDITVQSACDAANCAGNITVIDAITWNSGRALTLDATGSVTINAAITSTGAAGTKGGDFNVIAGTTTHNGDININADITTNGGAATGAGLAGGNVNLRTGNGAVIFGNGAVINTGGSAAAAGSNGAGGAAGSIAINSTAGIELNNGDLLAAGGAGAGAGDGSGTAGAGGRVSLTSTSNDISQGGNSRIVGAELQVQAGSGSIYLDNGNNEVEKIAASADSGDIYFSNTDTAGLTVTDIGGVSGVTTGDFGEIYLSARNLQVNSAVASENGSITLSADNGPQAGDFSGVVIDGTSVTTTDASISIYGRGGNGEGGNQAGVVLANGATVEAGGNGGIEVIAAGGSGAAGGNHGLVIEGNGSVDGSGIRSNGGSIAITAIGGSEGDDNNAVVFRNNGQIGTTTSNHAVTIKTTVGAGDTSTAYATDATGGYIATGYEDLTLEGNALSVKGDEPVSVRSTGTLTARSASSSFGSAFKLSEFTAGFDFNGGGNSGVGLNDLNAITIGKTGNTADIQIDQALDMNGGSISLTGGNVGLDDSLRADSLTVRASGNITQSEADGSFTLNSANLTSTGGDITLKGTGNRADSLTASAHGALTFDNGTNHLNLNGTLSGASVHLHAGSINQNWGSITTDALEVTASNGSVSLGQSNSVGTLAVDANGGDFTFNNGGKTTGKLTIGTVGETVGVSSSGSVTLNNIRDLEITEGVSAGTGVTVTASRSIDLGTEDATKLSLTDDEIDRISAQSLTLTTSGNVTNSADVRAGAISAMTITAGQGITRSGTGQLGFSHIDTGALTLTSNSTVDGQGIGTSTSNRLITVGASALTLTSSRDIHVDARTRAGGEGSANLDKLHIDSKSAAAANSSFSVRSTATLNLAGNGSVPNWYQAVPKGTYNISLTNTDALDFKFVGNAPINVNGATSVGAADFMLETAYGINVGSNITSTSGNITLKAGGALGNYIGINLDGTSIVTANGVITLDGKGGTGRNTDEYSTRSNQIGVQIAGGGSVRATGTGSVDITGRGGSTGSNYMNGQYGGNSDGVVITGTNSRVEAAGGNIAISGTGGTGSYDASATNDGIVLESGGAITNTSGSVKLTASATSGINNVFAEAIKQSGAGIIRAAGLEVVTTSGWANLKSSNNVGTLAGDVRGGFHFNNGGNHLSIGTVNGRAGFSDTSTSEIGLYNINALTVGESIQMASGTLNIAANTISIADDKRIGDRASNSSRNVKVRLTGSSTSNTAPSRNIAIGTNSADTLAITSTLLDKIHASELELATAGAISVTADTEFKHVDQLTLTSTGAISNAGANYLILSDTNNQGTLTLNGGSAGSLANAILVRGANRLNVNSPGQFNVEAYADGEPDNQLQYDLIDLRSVSINSTSGGLDRTYRILGGGLNYSATGTGSSYNVNANATRIVSGAGTLEDPYVYAPVDFSFTGNAGISINANSDLKGGALTVRATSGAITALNDVAIASGSASFWAAGNVTFSPGTSLDAKGNVTFRSDNAGGTFATGAGSSIASTGKIDIRADNVTLGTGTTLTTPGTVEVNQTTGTRTIQLGGASEGAGLSLTAAELDMISADTLIVGRNNSVEPTSGNITFTGATNLTGISNLILRSRSGSVSQSGGATLGVNNLEISLNTGNISLNQSGNTIRNFTGNTNGTIRLDNTGTLDVKGASSNGKSIQVTTSGNLVVSGAINATANTTGTNAAGGAITLTSTGGNLSVLSGGITSNGYSSGNNSQQTGGAITLAGRNVELGAVTIQSRGSSNSGNGAVGGSAGTISIDATDVGGTVTLDGTTITLTGGNGGFGTGSGAGVGGAFSLSDAVVLAPLSGSTQRTATINTGGRNVTLATVNGGASVANNLTINTAGTGPTLSYGSVTIGAIGASNAIGKLTLNNVGEVTLQDVRAAGIAITNTATNSNGTTRLNGDLHTNGANAGGIDINSKSIVLGANKGYTTENGGNIKLATQGSLTLANTSAFNSSGNIDLTATNGITVSGAALTTSGAGIIFGSNTTLASHLAIDTTGGGTAETGGNVEFRGTLNSTGGAKDLTIAAGTEGDVKFNGQVGNTAQLGAVTIDSANNVTTSNSFRAASFTQNASSIEGTTTIGGAMTLDGAFGFAGNALTVNQVLTAASATVTNAGLFTTGGFAFITTNGGFTQNGTGANLLAGVITTNDTDISFESAVRTNGNLSLYTGSTENGDVIFNSTLDSASASDNSNLTIITGGGEIVFDGAVGEDKALGNVTLTSGQNLDLDAFSSRSLTRNGTGSTTLASGAEVNTTNGQTYNSAVILGGNATLNGGMGAITFSNTVNGAGNLAVNTGGTTTFGGAVGGTTALTSLATDAGGTTVFSGGTVSTTGSQTYADNVELGANTTFASTGGNAITFGGTVNSASSGNYGLTVNTTGTTSFIGAVGANRALSTIAVAAQQGTLLMNGGLFNSTGAQTYNSGTIILGGDTTLQSTGAGAITLNGNVDAAICTVASLEVLTQGMTVFGGAIGTYRPLWSVTTDGSASTPGNTVVFANGTVVTLENQTYGELAVLDTNTSLKSLGQGTITFDGPVRAAQDGVQSLTVDTSGDIVFNGQVGDNNQRLASLDTGESIDGTVWINGGGVNTAGTQVYHQQVELGNNAILTGTTGTFDVGVEGNGNNLTLTFSGPTDLVGSKFTGIHYLTTDGEGVTNITGTVQTSARQTYNTDVVLGSDVVLKSTGTGSAGNISLLGSVDGPHALSIETAGGATLTGGVGTTTALDSLTTNTGLGTGIGGVVRTDGAQTYEGKVTVRADATLTSIDGEDITFGDTIDGAYNLAVNTTGATVFDGAVGGTIALASLTTNAGGSVEINGGGVRTTGEQTYGDAVTLGANATLSSTASGDIRFNGTVDGTYALTVNTAGATVFAGEIGGSEALVSLTTDAGGTSALNGGIVNTTGAQTYGDALTLGADTTLTSEEDGNIRFGGTVNGAHSLAVNTSGTTTFGGLVGGATALASLTTDAGGSVAINGGGITTSGDQTYGEAVTLGANATLTSTDAGDIRFDGTVDGAHALTVNTAGATVFEGEIGGGTALASLTTDAGGTSAINGGAVTTIGAQTFRDALTLGADTAFTSTDGGNIRFGGTLDGAYDLAVNTDGTTTFDGVVGGITALTSLETDGGGNVAINGGAITTTGAQSYGDDVTLGANTMLTSTGDGDITFSSTLDGAHSLAVRTGGITVFGDEVGGITALASLSTDAEGSVEINGGVVKTIGAQTYGDAVTLGADTTLTSTDGGDIRFNGTLGGTHALAVNTDGATVFEGAIGTLASLTTDAGGTSALNGGSVTTIGAQSFGDAVTLGADTTLTSTDGGNIRFGDTVDGAHSLAINTDGITTFDGLVGDTSPLTSLTTDAGGSVAINGGGVTTVGEQSYGDAVTLGADTTLASNEEGDITFAGTVDGAYDLAVNTDGATEFNGEVGGTSPLTSLTTDAGGTTAINGGGVTTVGAQSYGDAVTLGANTTLISEDEGDIRFAATVNGPGGLTINTDGATVFDGAIGGVSALANLTTDAGGTTAINGGGVTTVGAQSYGDAVTLGANTVLTSEDDGDIVFSSTLDGAYTLTVNTDGATTFDGEVGGTTALASLTTDGGGSVAINGGAITTTGLQSFGDALTLGANTTLESEDGGAITFGGTVNGAHDLTVNTNGATVFEGAIGGTTALASLTTDAGGTAAINGGSVVTTGAQSFGDAVTLGADIILGSTGQGAITFGSTIDGAHALTVNTGGATVFNGAIGGNSPLASLTTDYGGTTALNGGTVVTTGGQSFRDTVTLGANTTLTSEDEGHIVFLGTIDGAHSLTVNTDGQAWFSRSIGSDSPLASLTINAEASLDLNGGAITTSGAQAYNDAVTISADLVLTSEDGGNIRFGGTVDGPGGLTVNTGGATVFDGEVGGDTALASLTTDGGGTTTLNGGTVNTIGAQTYGDGLTLGADTTLTSTDGGNIRFNGTVDGVHSLAINTDGTTRFNGTVGGTEALTSLTTDTGGSLEINGGAITTTGAQTYGDNVTLGANTTLTSTDDGDIRFDGTVDGSGGLAVNTGGTTTFEGEVGGDTALAGLTTDAGGKVVINGGGVTTTGDQTYGDDVTLGADTTLTSTDGGDVRFNGTVDGAHSLAVNTDGATVFEGPVGGTTALTSLTTDAGGSTAVNGGKVVTTGEQTYGDVLTLGKDTNLISTDAGDIRFGDTVDGAHSLAVYTGGTTTFDGEVGGTTALTSLATDAGGNVEINGGGITTTGAQSYGDSVTVGADATLTSTDEGDIVFAGTVDGSGGLTVNTDGATVFEGEVGGTTELASLATDAGGTTTLNGGSVHTVGDQTYGDAVTLGADTVLVSSDEGNISFGGTLDGAHELEIETAGTTTFEGKVGGHTALAKLTTDEDGNAVINGGLIRTKGEQKFNDGVMVGANTEFVSDTAITFGGTLDGGWNITVTTPGITTFGGAIGSIEPVANLNGGNLNGGKGTGKIVIDGPSIALTGSLVFEEAVYVKNPTTVKTGGDALFYGAVKEGMSLIAVTAGGRIQFGRPLDNIKSYLPTLFAINSQSPMQFRPLSQVARPVSPTLGDGSVTQQSGGSNLQVVTLMPRQQGGAGTATLEIGNDAVNQAVNQIVADPVSRSTAFLVAVRGGVRTQGDEQ